MKFYLSLLFIIGLNFMHMGSVLAITPFMSFTPSTTWKVQSNQNSRVIQNLLEKDLSKVWSVEEDKATIYFTSNKAVNLKGYSVRNTGGTDYDPTQWTLSGSLNGKEWVDMDKKLNQGFAYRYQRNHYSLLSNEKNFSMYRLMLENTKAKRIGLSKIELITTEDTFYSVLPKVKTLFLDQDQDFQKYLSEASPNLREDIVFIALEVMHTLYASPKEAGPSPPRNLLVLFTQNSESYAFTQSLTKDEKFISINTTHLMKMIKRGKAKREEIIGLLYHEMTHVYQQMDTTIDKTLNLIEGMAEAVRMQAGYAEKSIQKDARWDQGYEITGGFFLWIEESNTPGFLKKINATLGKDDWQTSTIYAITNEKVEELWKKFQTTSTLPNVNPL